MKIKIAAGTDRGNERTDNEDAFVFCRDLSHPDWDSGKMSAYMQLTEAGAVGMVADGMGGANAGKKAAATAVEALKRCMSRTEELRACRTGRDIGERLRAFISEADSDIVRLSETDPESIGMGTTAVAAWIRGDRVHVVWCGDSRCYIFNPASGLKRLTRDHSYVQELVDRKELTEEQAFGHRDGNIITRCLGDTGTSSEPEIITCPIRENDTILLCTDGLCGYCRDKAIERILYRTYDDMSRCCTALIEEALGTGGYDNITVLAISCISDHATAPAVSFRTGIKRLFGIF